MIIRYNDGVIEDSTVMDVDNVYRVRIGLLAFCLVRYGYARSWI